MQKPCYIMPDGRVRSTGRLKLAAAKTQRVGGTADGAEPPGGAAFLFCCPALRNSSWSAVRADGWIHAAQGLCEPVAGFGPELRVAMRPT